MQLHCFFLGSLTTAIRSGELLREIRFPAARPGTRVACVESGNRSHDLSIAGVVAQAVIGQDGMCSDLRLGLFGAGERPQRLAGTEAVIRGRRPVAADLARAAEVAVSEAEVRGDTVASAEYRAKLVATLTQRALAQVAGHEVAAHV